MYYFVALLVAVCAAGIAYATSNKKIADKIRIIRPVHAKDQYVSKQMGMFHIIVVATLVAALSYIAALRILDTVKDGLGITKMIVSMLCMVGAACVDYREHRIPNFFSGLMAISGIAFMGAGIISDQAGAVAYATTSVVTAVCCTVFLLVASLLTKQGIGAGDIKLISALALIAGMYTVMGTLLFGMVLCSVVAIIALISKKVTLSDALPFGPFLFLGYMITILIGYF